MHRTRQSLRTATRSLATQATSSTASYTPPLKAGALPAYDQALAYIAKDRDHKLKQLEELKGNREVDQAALEKLEVEAWSNDPETRWKANNGQGELQLPLRSFKGVYKDFLKGKRDHWRSQLEPRSYLVHEQTFHLFDVSEADCQPLYFTADLSKPVYRFLAERKWRKEGDLAILVSSRSALLSYFALLMILILSIDATSDTDVCYTGSITRDRSRSRCADQNRSRTDRSGRFHFSSKCKSIPLIRTVNLC